ncbi:MAG: response regulator [Candidatus Omnitrophota bacterium]
MTNKKPRIVAIDDETLFMETIKEYFELRKYEIDTSSVAVQGIELINSKNPDVVILDLKMPGISGDEVLSLLKNKHPKTKVIFVTAYDDGGKTRTRLLGSGAFAYLDKPLRSLRELEDTVNKAYADNGGR